MLWEGLVENGFGFGFVRRWLSLSAGGAETELVEACENGFTAPAPVGAKGLGRVEVEFGAKGLGADGAPVVVGANGLLIVDHDATDVAVIWVYVFA